MSKKSIIPEECIPSIDGEFAHSLTTFFFFAAKGKDATDKNKSPMATSATQPPKIEPVDKTTSQNSDEHPSPTESCSETSRPYNDDTPAVQIPPTKPSTTHGSEFTEPGSRAASAGNSSRDKTATGTTSSSGHHSVLNSSSRDKTTGHSVFISVANFRDLNGTS